MDRKQHACVECGKGHATEAAMQRHERSNHAIKCAYCTVKFVSYRDMHAHVRQVHAPSVAIDDAIELYDLLCS